MGQYSVYGCAHVCVHLKKNMGHFYLSLSLFPLLPQADRYLLAQYLPEALPCSLCPTVLPDLPPRWLVALHELHPLGVEHFMEGEFLSVVIQTSLLFCVMDVLYDNAGSWVTVVQALQLISLSV